MILSSFPNFCQSDFCLVNFFSVSLQPFYQSFKICLKRQIIFPVRALKREGVRFSSSPSWGTTAESLADELNISEEHFAASAPLHGSQSRENLSADDSPVFFRSVVFSPEVPIRLDYHGKSVNMGQVRHFDCLGVYTILQCIFLIFRFPLDLQHEYDYETASLLIQQKKQQMIDTH